MNGDELDVKERTVLLRMSDSPIWVRLRDCLRDRGILPETTFVGELFNDDIRQYFGLVLTSDQKVIRFDFTFKESVDDATFTDWQDFTSRWAASRYDRQVSAALAVQQSGSLEPPPIQRWLDEEATVRINQVKDWFAAKGLVLKLRKEGDADFADLVLRETGKVLGRSYERGSSPAIAAEKAQMRYREEQIG
jgi:hypothetical protein